MIATPTANRAVADTTLVLNAPIATGMESGAHSTTGRLDGLFFKYAGSIYRITDQTTTTLTFTPGLLNAMVANQSILKIQSDFPRLVRSVMIQAATTDIFFSYEQDTTASGGEYFTLGNGLSKLLWNHESGEKPYEVFMTGTVAGTVELEVMRP